METLLKRLLITLFLCALPVMAQNVTGSSTLDTALIVGSGTTWSGADIGAQINTAYTALPSTGGWIYVLPQSGGGCYAYTTPIVFATLGKFVVLQGLAPSSSNAANGGGACLNYTPTTATSAITIDYGAAGGGVTHASGSGIRDLTLMNNLCVTNGGCSSSAIGVNVGPTNGGARGALFSAVNVSGFGDGYQFSDSSGVGWGVQWVNGSVTFNTTGINYTVNHENDSMLNLKVVTNGTGINLGGTVQGDLTITGGSIDSNTTCGINAPSGSNWIINGDSVHFENLGTTNVKYVCGVSGTKLYIYGGLAQDDTSGTSTNQNWFTFGQGIITLDIFGGNGGRTYSGSVFNVLDRAKLIIFNGATTAFPPTTVCSNQFLCDYQETSHTWQGFISTASLDLQESTCSSAVGFVFSTEVLCANSTSHLLTGNYNNGSFHPIPLIESGISACNTSTKAITYTTAFVNTPAVLVFDYTTKGGANLSAGPSASGFTVSCTGATDAFGWAAIGQPN